MPLSTRAVQTHTFFRRVAVSRSDSVLGSLSQQKDILQRKSSTRESRRSGRPTSSFRRRTSRVTLRLRSNRTSRSSRAGPGFGSRSFPSRRILETTEAYGGTQTRTSGLLRLTTRTALWACTTTLTTPLLEPSAASENAAAAVLPEAKCEGTAHPGRDREVPGR